MLLEFTIEDVIRQCHALPFKETKHPVLTGLGEIPEADFDLFLSHDTLPQRLAWRGISKEDYDRVKASFAEDGVPVCKEMRMEDMIKFKETLIAADMDLF